MVEKVSKRVRDQRKSELRWLVGGGAFLLSLLVLGWLALFWAERRAPLPDTRLTGLSLESRWSSILAASPEHHAFVRLSGPDTGSPDIVVVGTSDCPACVSFVENRLDGLVSAARERDWSLVYAGIGLTPTASVSSSFLACAPSGVSGSEIVRLSYESAARFARFQDLFQALPESVRSDDLVSCLSGVDEANSLWSNSLLRGLIVRSTPSVFVRMGSGSRVQILPGNAPLDTLVRHIEEALLSVR